MPVCPLLTYMKQKQIHLQLRDPAADTTSDSKSKWDGTEGIGPVVAVLEPPFRQKCGRFREGVLIAADGVVRKIESSLEESGKKD